MKKVIALLLVVMMLVLTGCGGKDAASDVSMDVQSV